MRWLPALLMAAGLVSPACAAEVPNVEVTLTLAGGRTHFKAGEPLALDLAFQVRQGVAELLEHQRDVVPASAADELIVRAQAGGDAPWADDRQRWLPAYGDHFAVARVPAGRVEHRQLYLNDWVRFDRPGRYTVQVQTRRVKGLPPLLSNPVSVEIELPTATEEAVRARDLASRIRASRDEVAAAQWARELGWLTGEAASDLQVDLLLNRHGANPCGASVDAGLWLARDRRHVVQRLEQALDDPGQLLTVRDAVLGKLTRLRYSLDGTPPLRLEQLGAEALRYGYVHRIARSLPQRHGESLMYAAAQVIDIAAPDSLDAREAGAALLTHFDEINPYMLDGLLDRHAAQLAGAELRAGLHRVLDRRRDVGRDAALRTLGRLWPEDMAPYVLAEACADRFAAWAQLAAFRPETLPEADACLRRKLLVEAAKQPRSYALAMVLQYVARLASPALVPDVEQLLPTLDTGVQQAALGASLAYLLRWAPERHLAQVLAYRDDPQLQFMTGFVAAAAYGTARDRLREQGLNDEGNGPPR